MRSMSSFSMFWISLRACWWGGVRSSSSLFPDQEVQCQLSDFGSVIIWWVCGDYSDHLVILYFLVSSFVVDLCWFMMNLTSTSAPPSPYLWQHSLFKIVLNQDQNRYRHILGNMMFQFRHTSSWMLPGWSLMLPCHSASLCFHRPHSQEAGPGTALPWKIIIHTRQSLHIYLSQTFKVCVFF